MRISDWSSDVCSSDLLADNIVHMVLARLPDAPEGTKGISLFLVPKFIVNEDGSLGSHNDLRCVSIEHKLGIKASPTAVMRSEEHTSELQSLMRISYAVFCLKKKKLNKTIKPNIIFFQIKRRIKV